jgi:hypothetical protein
MRVTKKVETETLKGIVVFEMLPYLERMKAVQDVYGKVSMKNEEKEVNSLSDLSEEMESGRKIAQLVFNQVKHVDLAIVGTSMDEFSVDKLSSVDQLSMFQDGVGVINQIGTALLNGYLLGNAKKKESEGQ